MKKTVKKSAAKKKAAPVKAVQKPVEIKPQAVVEKLPLAVRIAAWIGAIIGGLFLLLVVAVFATTYHPADIENQPVINGLNAPVLKANQQVKVLTWNVQFMAGKNYVFFFDTANSDGPDLRPSSKDIALTIDEVARVIKSEKPDVVLLQEVDGNAKRTDYEDQLKKLISLLPKEYCSQTSAWYWRAAFVPHPKVMGRVGVKLAVISKYRIDEAIRYQFPLMPNNFLLRQLNFKRAILEARIPVEGGKVLSVFSTHLDAFAQGNDTMERQVALVKTIMERRTAEGAYWMAGGDYNLLAPGKSYADLPDHQKIYYKKESELAPLFEKYQAIPSLSEINGPDGKKWFTHFPNDPLVKRPDRTIDFIFASKNIKIEKHYVRNADTLRISDHLPLVSVVTLKK